MPKKGKKSRFEEKIEFLETHVPAGRTPEGKVFYRPKAKAELEREGQRVSDTEPPEEPPIEGSITQGRLL